MLTAKDGGGNEACARRGRDLPLTKGHFVPKAGRMPVDSLPPFPYRRTSDMPCFFGSLQNRQVSAKPLHRPLRPIAVHVVRECLSKIV